MLQKLCDNSSLCRNEWDKVTYHMNSCKYVLYQVFGMVEEHCKFLPDATLCDSFFKKYSCWYKTQLAKLTWTVSLCVLHEIFPFLIIFPVHFHLNILASISLTLLRLFSLNLCTYFDKNLTSSFLISSLCSFKLFRYSIWHHFHVHFDLIFVLNFFYPLCFFSTTFCAHVLILLFFSFWPQFVFVFWILGPKFFFSFAPTVLYSCDPICLVIWNSFFVISYVLPSSELIFVLVNMFTLVCAHFDLLFCLIWPQLLCSIDLPEGCCPPSSWPDQWAWGHSCRSGWWIPGKLRNMVDEFLEH
jgi:hypothetical protein